MSVRRHEITAFIGPSGCGKTTVLRCFNRMNDLIEGARVEGAIDYHGVNLYGEKVNAVEVRRRIGMVFQKPNPFPKSIYDNIAYGPRIGGIKKQRRARRRSSSARCAGGAVGRGQGPAQGVRAGHVRRSAAAPVHRPGDRGRPRGHPDGRAVLGARPDRDRSHRGPDARDQDRLHDRDRDPQHAAGGPRQRRHRLLLDRGQPRRATSAPACSSSSTGPTRSSRTPSDERTENYITGRFG